MFRGGDSTASQPRVACHLVLSVIYQTVLFQLDLYVNGMDGTIRQSRLNECRTYMMQRHDDRRTQMQIALLTSSASWSFNDGITGIAGIADIIIEPPPLTMCGAIGDIGGLAIGCCTNELACGATISTGALTCAAICRGGVAVGVGVGAAWTGLTSLWVPGSSCTFAARTFC